MSQTRANFILLSVLLSLVGLALAWYEHPSVQTLSFIDAFIVMVGAVFAHLAVNLFNEYYDYKTGIDLQTKRTPFSGGSGIVSSGRLSSGSVLRAGIICITIAFIIGIYFSITAHWFLLVFIGVGAFTILFYNTILARIFLGEIFSGLTLGTFLVYGTYVAMTAEPSMQVKYLLPNNVLLAGIFPGIFTFLLLFINEFPDLEADKEGGRRHLVILLGRKKSAYIYTVIILITFIGFILLYAYNLMPYWILFSLILFPYAIKTALIAIRHSDFPQAFINAQKRNTLLVLGADLMLAISIISGIIF